MSKKGRAPQAQKGKIIKVGDWVKWDAESGGVVTRVMGTSPGGMVVCAHYDAKGVMHISMGSGEGIERVGLKSPLSIEVEDQLVFMFWEVTKRLDDGAEMSDYITAVAMWPGGERELLQ